jgi:hypothetical protein
MSGTNGDLIWGGYFGEGVAGGVEVSLDFDWMAFDRLGEGCRCGFYDRD